jgi:DNA polymerase III epsilon subunit-like protein
MVFDTETTGLPKSRKSLLENTEEWPFIVQLSWLTYDTETSTICSISDNIIRLPEGFIIDPFCVKIHGITSEMSEIHGINRYIALIKFMDEFDMSDIVIAHNMDFDKNVLLVELIREKNERNNSVDNYYIESKKTMILQSTKMGCTMQDGLNLCNIKATFRNSPKEYVKFPTLGELHNRCFGFVPKKLHNSLNDSVVCLRCFYQMRFNKDIILENEQLREMIEEMKP